MSLFKKNMWDKEDKGQMPHGGTLAVWGSPGSGKTTVAIKLAEYLTSKGNNVILIFTDMTTPPIHYICLPDELIGDRSLGSILANAHVTEDLVKKNCLFYQNNKFLSIMGMLTGENRFSYPPYEDTQAKELLECCEKISPFVIVDCSSHIATNILTTNALMLADSVIQLCSCDRKSVSYFESQMPLLADDKWGKERFIRVASNVKPNQAIGSIAEILGDVNYHIPYSQEIETQFLERNLLKKCEFRESRNFRSEIEKISREVFGI